MSEFIDVFGVPTTERRIGGLSYVIDRPSEYNGSPVFYWQSRCSECGKQMVVFTKLER